MSWHMTHDNNDDNNNDNDNDNDNDDEQNGMMAYITVLTVSCVQCCTSSSSLQANTSTGGGQVPVHSSDFPKSLARGKF